MEYNFIIQSANTLLFLNGPKTIGRYSRSHFRTQLKIFITRALYVFSQFAHVVYLAFYIVPNSMKYK